MQVLHQAPPAATPVPTPDRLQLAMSDSSRLHRGGSDSPLVTRSELAKILRVSPNVVSKLALSGRIPRIRVGHRTILYHVLDVLRSLSTDPERTTGPDVAAWRRESECAEASATLDAGSSAAPESRPRLSYQDRLRIAGRG